MPKRSSKKRRTSKKGRKSNTPWYAKGYSVQWLTKELWKLKGLVNSEIFKIDTDVTQSPILYDGVYTSNLAAIANGDTDITRTGNSVYVRSVNVKGQVEWNPAGLGVQYMRVMVVLDTQQIGDTAPTPAQVIQTVGGSNSYNAHLQIATVGRFKILSNTIFAVNGVAVKSRAININLPMRHHIRFNGTGSGDIQRGGLYLMAISSSAADGPLLSFNSRTSFHDN